MGGYSANIKKDQVCTLFTVIPMSLGVTTNAAKVENLENEGTLKIKC